MNMSGLHFKKQNNMTVIELKKRLIQKINQTENNGILEEMYRLIVNEDTDSNIYIYFLTTRKML